MKDLGLGANQLGHSEKDLMDLYVKCMSTQIENVDLKDKNKLDGIEIIRLKRQLKERDKLISQYLPEHNQLLNELRIQLDDEDGNMSPDTMYDPNAINQAKYLKSREDFFRSQLPKNKQTATLDFLNRDVLHTQQTMADFHTTRGFNKSK